MTINFQKYADGLVPAIVQDAATQRVLMLGFMSEESFELTQTTGKVTFYSRSRQRIWQKGESSGNLLLVKKILIDCDSDTLLIKAQPTGPACHSGADTCFNEENRPDNFLVELEQTIWERKGWPVEGSYTSTLFAAGINKIAQKVGEEAIELIIEAKDADTKRFRTEAADLLYHLIVLLAEKDTTIYDVIEVLKTRKRS